MTWYKVGGMDSRIKNIIFDWGGVLLDLDTEGCLRNFEEAGASTIRNYVMEKNEATFFHRYGCGMISTEEFRDEVRGLVGKHLSDSEVDAIWNSELLTIPEYKLKLLKELASCHRLFLLSNTNDLHWKHGSQSAFNYHGEDLKKCFTQIFLSHELKMAKPDPAIFRKVLDVAGLKPEETLFIDDAEKNCIAAASLGIQVVCYVPGEDLSLLF